MGSFNYDKKVEHEKLAAKAYSAGDLKLAFHHTCQAAQFTFLLAKANSGKIAEAYLRNAQGLLEMAKKLQPKPQSVEAAAKPGEKSENAGNTFKAAERPNMKLADVAGMESVKDNFRELVIMPLKYPELARKHGIKRGGGVLLYGPPGTGKTFIVRALAGELDACVYVIKSSDIITKWVGETEKQLSALFEEARKQPLSVIFIDEIDAMMPDRNKQDMANHENRMVTSMLQELDGFASKDAQNTLLFIGATNRPYAIDSAFLRPGRFDTKIEVGLPDLESRQSILKLFFKKRGAALSEELLLDVATRSEGYNCADVDSLAQTVATIAFKRDIGAENPSAEPVYTKDMFDEALEQVKSTVTEKDLQLIKNWEVEAGIKKN